MNSQLEKAMYDVSERLIAYLPNIIAAVVLLVVGWLLGWIVKRIVIQLMLVLRFDRLLRRFKWGTGLGKADVRHAVLEFIGNSVFIIVFLILLNAALEALRLPVLSDVLRVAVLFIPKLFVGLAVFIVGWVATNWMTGAVLRALTKESVPRATLIARFVKFVALFFCGAMALSQLDIAREIVVIGFSVVMITLGIITIFLTTNGARKSLFGFGDTPES